MEPPGGIDSRRGDVTRARARKRARDDPNDARDADDPDARMDDETTVDDDDDRGKGADAADWKNISTGDAGGARDGA